jgi:hypothetical protein
MPDLEMIQKPRSKSINGLGQNSPPVILLAPNPKTFL